MAKLEKVNCKVAGKGVSSGNAYSFSVCFAVMTLYKFMPHLFLKEY